MGKFNDLTGQTFGRLTALRAEIRNSRTYWHCICVCGNNHITYASHLRSGTVKSCGCLRAEVATGDGLSSARVYFSTYSARVRARGIPWELTFEQFYEITQQNCIRCGRAPDRVYRNKMCTNTFTHNSVGTHERHMGYTQDNCFPSCSACNKKKTSA